MPKPRQIQLYGIGTAKSGTHSLAALFGQPCQSAHEPESGKLMDLIFAARTGLIDDDSVKSELLMRDQRLQLYMDSSQLNYFIIDKLLDLFADAKFILTIRDPWSWLDSFINHQLSRKASAKWCRLRDMRFRPDLHKHPPSENLLSKLGLYTLDGYLGYWCEHNTQVLQKIPTDRLLVVRTDQISHSIEKIAAFAHLNSATLKAENSHTFKAVKKFDLLRQIDDQYLEDKVNAHCADLLANYFPDIRPCPSTGVSVTASTDL